MTQADRMEKEGKKTEQERREFPGLTDPKGPPEFKLRALSIEMEKYKNKLETETDEERRRKKIHKASDVTALSIDAAEAEMGRMPKSEEGNQKVREISKNNVRVGFEKFRAWAKENFGVLSVVAISIAGIITMRWWPERKPLWVHRTVWVLLEKRYQN